MCDGKHSGIWKATLISCIGSYTHQTKRVKWSHGTKEAEILTHKANRDVYESIEYYEEESIFDRTTLLH